MPIRHLPPIALAGEALVSAGGPEHPMRLATRRAAGLDDGGWQPTLRDEVKAYFDAMATEWHTRTSPQRTAIVEDALTRGIGSTDVHAGIAVEVGSGTGSYSSLIATRFSSVLAIDLSLAMLQQAPTAPACRVQADGSMLPLRDRSAAAGRPDQRLPVPRRSRACPRARRRDCVGQQQRRTDADLSVA